MPPRKSTFTGPQSLASPSTVKAKAEEVADAGEGKKTLYIFMCHCDDDIAQSLFAIDIPNRLPPPPSTAWPTSEVSDLDPISPILEFRRGDFADAMESVALGSKLYFFGGTFYERKEFRGQLVIRGRRYLRDVHVFDAAAPATTPTTNARNLVSKGKPMNLAKVDICAFAARGKIYVIGKTVERDGGVCFEAFDPVLDEWTALPSPRTPRVIFQLHVVMGEKALFVTDGCGCFCFDLDKGEWTSPPESFLFGAQALFVGGSLYKRQLRTVLKYSLGTVLKYSLGDSGEISEMYLSPDVIELNDYLCQVVDPTFSLVHLGGSRFCHIVHGHPTEHIPVGFYDPLYDYDKNCLYLSIFEDLGEFYTVDDKTYFKGKSLYFQRFLIKTSWDNDGGILKCFSVCSGGNEGKPSDSRRVSYEIRKKGQTLVEPKSVENYDKILRTAQSDSSISERCFGSQHHDHVIGYGGGMRPKDTSGGHSSSAELEARLYAKEIEIELLKSRLEEMESHIKKHHDLCAQCSQSNPPSRMANNEEFEQRFEHASSRRIPSL